MPSADERWTRWVWRRTAGGPGGAPPPPPRRPPGVAIGTGVEHAPRLLEDQRAVVGPISDLDVHGADPVGPDAHPVPALRLHNGVDARSDDAAVDHVEVDAVPL